MSAFRCLLAGAALAGLLLANMAAGHAAGALAIGSCGAYGFAYALLFCSLQLPFEE